MPRLLLALPVLLAFLVLGCAAPGGDPAAEEPAAEHPVLHGQVLDPLGQPLAGVQVTIHGGFATRWVTGTTTTDAEGRYRFEDPQGGMMEVDGRWDRYVGVCVGSVRGVNPPEYLPWKDVTVPSLPGAVVVLDFVFDPESVPVEVRG